MDATVKHCLRNKKKERKVDVVPVPELKLPVPFAPAAAAVSGGAGSGAHQNREPRVPTDPTQLLQGWVSSAGEMGHWTPTTEIVFSW